VNYLPEQSCPDSRLDALTQKKRVLILSYLKYVDDFTDLLLDHLAVNLACGDIVIARQGHVKITLIIPKIEIYFASIV
jgi:hypothetical protein